MNPPRWTEITPSQYAWEREALQFLKTRLPDHEPFRAWSNFEFIAEDGSINEVDLLVVSLYKVYLVEIKSWRGTISGDANTWRREVDGKSFSDDSPLLLANRKAKKLASLLKRQKALIRHRKPYVEATVFLSRMGVRCKLEGRARTGVYLASESDSSRRTTVVDVLCGNASHDGQRIDRPLSRAFMRAMDQAGIRPSQRRRQAGDFVLRELLLETDTYQDWQAEHISVPSSKRRVRIFPCRASSETEREERRRVAEREYLLLDGVTHEGILRVEFLTSSEQGPALVFEHAPEAERLDSFLDRRGDTLDCATRLNLMRQLAETMKHAHERHLYHRALSPRKILVFRPDTPQPQLKIFDWQTGKHYGTQVSRSAETTFGLSGEDRNDVYFAPETNLGAPIAEKLDIFSLGAIGYRLFCGKPPAPTVEALQARLKEGGLRLSDALDGTPDSLQFVVEYATDPQVLDRLDSMSEFLGQLAEAEKELVAAQGPEGGFVNPLDARANDRLEHGFLVTRRLGKGSTAIALQVRHGERNGVLKVALDPSRNNSIRREGELLRSLRHQNIVEVYRDVELSGHAALFMAMAGSENKSGTYTLSDRIREEGRLSLDLLQRFGDQLLGVVEWLEEKGVSHRDLKPDNIGVSGSPLGLVVFDFSLAEVRPDNIRAGTRRYLDPFLTLRKPPRWDAYAERFAAAMTLHEMATGSLPIWGDGLSEPAVIKEEVSLDAELFDPSVREALSAFFAKALARDYGSRFDNAEEMRRSWFRCFEVIDVATNQEENGDDLPSDFDAVSDTTSLSAIGLSPRVLNALERMGAHTVGELVALPRIRFYRNKGIGQSVVRRIRELSERLAEHLAELGRTIETASIDEEDAGEAPSPSIWSIDRLASRLIPSRLPEEQARLARWAIRLEGDIGRFPSQVEIARALDVPSADLADRVHQLRTRWQRQPWMKPLCDSAATLISKSGGAMTADELAEALAANRGSVASGNLRKHRAAAAVTAALEVESSRKDCRYRLYRDSGLPLILATEALDASISASAAERAKWIHELGRMADQLADEDPLAPPARVLEMFAAVESPWGMPPLDADRRLRLAIRFAAKAAISPRDELYPRGMPAARAMKLGASSLLGPRALSADQVRKRLASRFPAAGPLPLRPALDELVAEAGLNLVWNEEVGKYRSETSRPSYLTGSSTTQEGSDADDDLDGTRVLDTQLRRAVEAQGFVALSIPPKYLLDVERYLETTFALRPFSIEAALIDHMKSIANALGVNWKAALDADSSAPGSTHRRRLQQLVQRAISRLRGEIVEARAPLLLTRPGLLARYHQLDLLAEVQDACQRGNAPAARILCIAAESTDNAPVIDGQTLTVTFAAAWSRPVAAWLSRATSAGVCVGLECADRGEKLANIEQATASQ